MSVDDVLFGFGGSKAKKVITPPPIALPAAGAPLKAPTILDPAIAAAGEDARLAAAQAQGRISTILTSGLGDTSPATTSKKTLLGA